MKRLLKKGAITLTAVFCMAAGSYGMSKPKPLNKPTVSIVKDSPISPLKKAFGVACIATSLFITYKIARMKTPRYNGPSDCLRR